VREQQFIIANLILQLRYMIF